MIKRLSGFTLIELLIVVAIIAILAAIAVPNFLEAQVRSKVSRVKSDQRSLATAIEAYYVDNNSYPACDISTSGHFGADKTASGSKITLAGDKIQQTPTFRQRGTTTADGSSLMTLTTPVAYVTSIFADPFADSKPVSFRYSTPQYGGAGWVSWSFGPDTDEGDSGPTLAGDTPLTAVSSINYVTDTCYSPSGQTPSAVMINFTYDPTNGTTSSGDVYRVKQ